jgi:hypothetical protein
MMLLPSLGRFEAGDPNSSSTRRFRVMVHRMRTARKGNNHLPDGWALVHGARRDS